MDSDNEVWVYTPQSWEESMSNVSTWSRWVKKRFSFAETLGHSETDTQAQNKDKVWHHNDIESDWERVILAIVSAPEWSVCCTFLATPQP